MRFQRLSQYRSVWSSLQCFDTVGQAARRASTYLSHYLPVSKVLWPLWIYLSLRLDTRVQPQPQDVISYYCMFTIKCCLQCFDTVNWASGRAYGLQKLSDEVLVWLSVWTEVQIVCIWSSWCHCIPKPHHLLPHLNPDWFYLSGTEVVLEKRL